MSFDKLVQQINANSENQRIRGTYFEYLVRAYLTNEPTFRNEFANVWMLNDVPERLNIPKLDLGVDLVAEKYTGEVVAVQAKFYEKAIQKTNIDSFLGELGKSYYDSGIIVSSTDNWGKNAEKALDNRDDVIRIGLSDLRNSRIDWDQFYFDKPDEVKTKEKKKLRKYQCDVREKALAHYQNNERGQLIMAPGTGKTFTSLKVAEAMAKKEGKEQFVVLYLVPSIQLLTQTLRGWNSDTEMTMSSMAVTSDRNASKESVNHDGSNIPIRPSDIGFPATTSYEKLLYNYQELKSKTKSDLLVVFGTYQSIDVVGQAQKNGFPEFDLIIADEAHRTTGAKGLGEEDSSFVKVHSDSHVKGVKRLYQTATPKLYGMEAKKKAEENSIIISSMDDESRYGSVFYRLGFGDAISQDILTDYKLMVLAVDESVIQKDMQKSLSNPENGLGLDDIGRIIGIWNGMVKRESFSNAVSGDPMQRAIAFSRTIKDSQRIANEFENIVNDYLESEEGFKAEVRHVDGSMNALQKNEALDWLASEDIPDNSARILSNVRFLTEGIDVPNLDAIIFLSPRKSQVDIVQAVGRIIRKSPDKDYGYIILPIVIPAGETPEAILDNNKTYDVIWQVLNALRSVDERFEATINKLELNKEKPDKISLIGVGGAPDDPTFKNADSYSNDKAYYQTELELDWEAVEGAIYGKIVKKVGDRRYLEDWSEDVAKIARRHIDYIKIILEKSKLANSSFEKFISSLRHNINDSITNDQAIEMLAQHLITLPIFEALFEKYSFVRNNPVSLAMEEIVYELSKYGFEKEQKELQPFYDSVKKRAEGIDNAEAKQKIIITLYDKFFRTGFRSTTDRLGIVFTPIEVVDFIVKSIDNILEKHFAKSIASNDVHILDPFTGTGTFLVRILSLLKQQLDNGDISLTDFTRKYSQELHANEIVLLSYYIAAINIETTYNEISSSSEYSPFTGIVLTDTFGSTEKEATMDDEFFGNNDQRLKHQMGLPINVILGNPPYSGGQSNENENNQNVKYLKLDSLITEEYAAYTNSKSLKSLYDPYIRAYMWASKRISSRGVIAFVSPNTIIDGKNTDGIRKKWYEEFNAIYCFNLRGDQYTQGEQSKKEGGKIFGSGSRTPIAIFILVKDGTDNHEIFYHDIGDYLSRKEKLSIISDFASVKGLSDTWTKIIPDANNDWINQKSEEFDRYEPIFEGKDGVFLNKALGVNTSRDQWVYSFNRETLIENVKKMITNYNSEVSRLKKVVNPKNEINQDESFVKWSRGLKNKLEKKEKIKFDEKNITLSMYRPFVKKWLYYDKDMNENPGKYKDLNMDGELILYLTGVGAKRDFSAFVTNVVPNLDLMEKGQGFPLKYTLNDLDQLFEMDSNINGKIVEKFDFKNDIEVFFYVYAILNHKEFKERFKNDLKKSLPKIPILEEKEKFIRFGEKLVDLHLNYEEAPLFEANIQGGNSSNKKVGRIRIKNNDIIVNQDLTIKDVPKEAFEYIVNGKSPVAWIADQYQEKQFPKSLIKQKPNDYKGEKYVFELILKLISVSIETVKIIDSMPSLKIEKSCVSE
ncbi:MULTISPECIES: type ISP restriction/modification enzyme [Bacillus]|uniref:type ISP restriction/modification enzyme n=1 Tax=Bacillus TaxID=1386 RepID=UPI000BA7CD4D|nr:MULTISPECIES: type ISP restriction/modification enzyme [Bacillus]MDH3079411.1 DEAD/DEAH box helicase family protein [Bacillus amyloliquefaciens]MDU0075875.1 type ISP restriction/modification enzyme [Bacillus sp. IG2]MDU0101356.1 type ISP restriction/modification enzyme [Bacillus sp. IS1]PAF02681.1 helicase [Bacillus velezensis]